ncbi:MAG: SDR family oxidoreductase [Clostridia bacterium]
MKDMQGKLCIVTGANTGIGKATVLALADRGAQVIMACRSQERGQRALDELMQTPGRSLTLLPIDLADLASVRQFAEMIYATYDHVDVLINNAGMLARERQLSKDGFEMMFQVNYLGHFLLTILLLPLLRRAKQGRIIMTSSLAHKWTDVRFDDLNFVHHYNRFLVYGHAKLCNLLFARYISAQLHTEHSHVTINAVHPGIVASSIVVDRRNNAFAWIAALSKVVLLSPREGAKTGVFLACDKSVATISGAYFVRCKTAKSSAQSNNMETASKLFTQSMQMLGLSDHLAK